MMKLLMSFQIAGVGEPAPAMCTTEGLLSSVDIQVHLEIGTGHKALLTQGAGERPLSVVDDHMLPQVTLVDKLLIAARATIRSFYGTRSNVYGEITRVGGSCGARSKMAIRK